MPLTITLTKNEIITLSYALTSTIRANKELMEELKKRHMAIDDLKQLDKDMGKVQKKIEELIS